MNDIILSSFLNIFANFGSQRKLDRDKCEQTISDYLSRFYGIRNTKSYFRLYQDLRDLYDTTPEMAQGDSVIRGICEKISTKISRLDKLTLALRLMEFSSFRPDGFQKDDELLNTAAECLGIETGIKDAMSAFVSEDESCESVKIIPLDGEAGHLKTLLLDGKMYFSYIGERSLWMDDIKITPGVYQVWQKSSILKSSHFDPIYYSTIMAHYHEADMLQAVKLEGRNIEFRFDDKSDNGMHNFSFTLSGGELVAIMGGSGVGKSTLLSLLNGTLIPQSGTITINGLPLNNPAAKNLVGFVPQDDILVEELTVYQNLLFTAKLCFDGMPQEKIEQKVLATLSDLDLLQAKDLKVGSPLSKFISGGQRKRLNIALELIREPSILFLDEPTSGLSSADTEKVINLLKEQTERGRLIVANIHQPSSDVYKLFDRLWVLDKGGYPIYDGNPIEAISYFKGAAGSADYRTSACPVCGNVNPEVVLNIVEEKSFDDNGNLSSARKVTPQQWHELYVSNRPEMAAPEQKDIPDTGQKRPNVLRQTAIFLRRNFSAKITNLQYILVTLLEAPLLAFVSAALTKFTPDGFERYSMMENSYFTSYMFMAVIVSIFLGMSGSAEEIIRDRAILKRESFLGLSHGAYISSKIIYMAMVCLVQSLLFVLVGNHIMEVTGMFWTWWLVLFMASFLAALMGLLLSQCLDSVVAIYISIPILLIPQILLCGLVVDFGDLAKNSKTGNVPVIGEIIPSRWAYEAIAVASFTDGAYEKIVYEDEREQFKAQWFDHAFIYELECQNEKRQESVLKAELPYLAEMFNLEPFSGEISDYAAVEAYLNNARAEVQKIGNATTLAIDRKLTQEIGRTSMEELQELKNRTYNLNLENLVWGRNKERLYTVVGDRILPRVGHIFLPSRTRDGRAPLYTGKKTLGSWTVSTLEYNILVQLLICILLAAALYSDFPGRFVRKKR